MLPMAVQLAQQHGHMEVQGSRNSTYNFW